jgi:hypothetical protein
MLPLAASIVALAFQVPDPVPTYEVGYLVHEGAAYVPSPVYPLAYKGDLLKWSADGKRAAFVAPTQLNPSQYARTAFQGKVDDLQSLMIWNADTGRTTEVVRPRDATEGFSKFEFLGPGSDLVVWTFRGATVEETTTRLLYVPAGGEAREVPIADTTGMSLAVSRKQRSVLIMTTRGAWQMDAGTVNEVKLPEETEAIIGLAADDTAQLVGKTTDGTARFYAYDFATHRTTMLVEPKPLSYHRENATPPFLFDFYEPTGLKRNTNIAEEDLSSIVAGTRRLSDEDGGIRMDVVERTGEKRRRYPFIWEMSRYYYPSPDGLSIAYNCQGMLCVRSLIKCDPATTAKLLSQN